MDDARVPIVSIITPTYAHERYIEECLESLAAQTFGDWEAIVVDDGSPDATLERARRLADDRIRILPRDHVGLNGLGQTYNVGLAECRGEFVGVLEGDDRWRPDKLAHQVPVLRSDPTLVLAYARYATIGAHGDRLAAPPLAGPVRDGPTDALGPLLLDSFVELGTTLIRRDALDAVGGFRQIPGHRHVDYATFLALAERGRFFASDRVVAEWRRHAGSSTVQAVTSLASFAGPRACRDLALDVRRRHVLRTDLPRDEEIRTSWDGVLARRYWHGGRVLQAQGRRREARKLFASGLRVRGVPIRQRVLLAGGVLASILGLDIERIATAARGRSSLSDL